MEARKKGNVHMLRLDRGEPVVASLCEYVGKAGIRGGSIVGLGALEGAEIGYNPDRDRDRFILTEQGVVIVQKGAKI